jgi:hypothetical protein
VKKRHFGALGVSKSGAGQALWKINMVNNTVGADARLLHELGGVDVVDLRLWLMKTKYISWTSSQIG